jgi:phage terminase small subunit
MLTPKQELFAVKVAEGMNYSDAYRSAYNTKKMTDKSIWEKASELANSVKVAERLKQLRDMNAKASIMSAKDRKMWLTSVINDRDADINARLRAADLLNRMEGEYVQKVEANVVNEVNINIELVDD